MDQVSKGECFVFLSVLNFEEIIKTLVLIQEKYLSHNNERLTRHEVCTQCSEGCTFYRCKDKKMSVYERRVCQIGFELFIFVQKTKLVFPQMVNITLGQTQANYNFKSTIESLLTIINKQMAKFNVFRETFRKHMHRLYIEKQKEKNAEKKKKILVAKEEKEEESELNKLKDNSLKSLKNIGKDESRDGKSSDKDSSLNSMEEDVRNQSILKKATLMEEEKGKPKNETNLGYKRVSKGVQETESLKSAESLKYVITERDEGGDKGKQNGSEVGKQKGFSLLEIYEKFNSSSETFGAQRPAKEGETGGTLKLHGLERVFKAEESDFLRANYREYLAELERHKIKGAVEFYTKGVMTMRLTDQHGSRSEEEFKSVQNTVYFVVPNILGFLDKPTIEGIIKKLVKYPPRTRKVVLLREVNLQMLNLVEYQKLYSFKELYWIVSIANFLKVINISIIISLNVYLLIFVKDSNVDESRGAGLLWSWAVLSCCVSGVTFIATPIEKFFLSKKYSSAFSVYKSKVEGELLDIRERLVIIHDQAFRLFTLDIYLKLLNSVNWLFTFAFFKYLVALLHYENMFQFLIFYLGVTTALASDSKGEYLQLFLILLKTNTIYRLYSYFSFDLADILIYFASLLILLYNFGIVYYTLFQTPDFENKTFLCSTLSACVQLSIEYSLKGVNIVTKKIGFIGYAGENYYQRSIFDTLVFLLTSFLSSLMLLSTPPLLTQGFFITRLNNKRLDSNALKKIIRSECLVCGLAKNAMEKK
jgi:predicted RNA-binding protein YlxR (DUF448 family)